MVDQETKIEILIREIHKATEKGVPFVDAVVEYCEEKEIEPETMGELIRDIPYLKSKILNEAQELRLVERTSKLPL